MQKRIIRALLLVILAISIFLLVQQIKNGLLKKAIYSDIDSLFGKTYSFTNKISRHVSIGSATDDKQNIQGCYKLVYEINIYCSICLEELKSIHLLYLKLKEVSGIALLLVTPEKSLSYVNFHISQSLHDYDLWIAQQEFRSEDFRLYLLDEHDKIVMAGNIFKYPFIENTYFERLKRLGSVR